jgi:hypothetical protein
MGYNNILTTVKVVLFCKKENVFKSDENSSVDNQSGSFSVSFIKDDLDIIKSRF